VHKAPNTFRIFCLGGSTTYGHPYFDSTSFSGWLRELLPEIDPSKNWEVINCGGISYASYRVANLMQELLGYQPDLFIIYTGHNEFLEARTYRQLLETPSLVLGAGGLASRTRIYAVVSSLLRSMQKGPSPNKSDRSDQLVQLPGEVNALLDNSAGPVVYHRDDAQRAKTFQHFEFNLIRMIQMAQSNGAKTILVTPASNLGQCEPFKSQHRDGLVGAELQEWTNQFETARELFANGKYPAALASINRAVELDKRHAGGYYLRGRILQYLGESKRARIDFLRARDEDVCTLRAPQDVIDIVRKVAAQQNAPLVDFVKWADEHSGDGITDDKLFLDHVHATIDAYRELALMLAKSIGVMGDLKAKIAYDDAKIQAKTAQLISRINPAQHGTALRNISKVYSWAGKKEDADRVALRALELAPEDADTVYQAANAFVRLGKVDEAIEMYKKVARLDPAFSISVYASLGYAYGVKGDEAKCLENYLMALQLNPNYSLIQYNVANIYEQRQELDNAVSHYQKAIQGNPQDYQAIYRLGLVYSMQQKWQLAQAQFLEASRLNPSTIEPHLGLGKVQLALGDKSAAKAQFQWVLERAPTNQEALESLNNLKSR
jgi:tetratricopeptide (TPR) repeat protein